MAGEMEDKSRLEQEQLVLRELMWRAHKVQIQTAR
jgi:hypothetical protein